MMGKMKSRYSSEVEPRIAPVVDSAADLFLVVLRLLQSSRMCLHTIVCRCLVILLGSATNVVGAAACTQLLVAVW